MALSPNEIFKLTIQFSDTKIKTYFLETEYLAKFFPQKVGRAKNTELTIKGPSSNKNQITSLTIKDLAYLITMIDSSLSNEEKTTILHFFHTALPRKSSAFQSPPPPLLIEHGPPTNRLQLFSLVPSTIQNLEGNPIPLASHPDIVSKKEKGKEIQNFQPPSVKFETVATNKETKSIDHKKLLEELYERVDTNINAYLKNSCKLRRSSQRDRVIHELQEFEKTLTADIKKESSSPIELQRYYTIYRQGIQYFRHQTQKDHDRTNCFLKGIKSIFGTESRLVAAFDHALTNTPQSFSPNSDRKELRDYLNKQPLNSELTKIFSEAEAKVIMSTPNSA